MAESLTAKVQRTHSPVNRMAASVIRSGVHYEETFVPKNEIVSDTLLPMRSYPPTANPVDDLTGRKFGRFTVIGLAATANSWVVRCACGRYLYRKARVLKTSDLEGTLQVMCPRCSFELKRKAGGIALPHIERKSLHSAALPMFNALQEILRIGLTKSTREMAQDALGVATGTHRMNYETGVLTKIE